MNFYEFLELEERDKIFAIWHYGHYLMTKEHGGLTRKLYAIEDFYVEVCQTPEDEIGLINCFESIDFIESYLDLISLKELEIIVRGA